MKYKKVLSRISIREYLNYIYDKIINKLLDKELKNLIIEK